MVVAEIVEEEDVVEETEVVAEEAVAGLERQLKFSSTKSRCFLIHFSFNIDY